MIPLFKPRPLTGCYLKEVLDSGHLVTGPMVERLRAAAARMAYVYPDHVAIGASATACLEAIHKLVNWSYLVLKPEATWPLFRVMAETHGWGTTDNPDAVDNAWTLYTGTTDNPDAVDNAWTLYTDIGGESISTRNMAERGILDCSHSWKPAVSASIRFAFASISPIKLCDGVQGGVVWCKYSEEAKELQGILNYGFLDGHDKPRDWRTRDPRGWRWNMSDIHAALNLEAIQRLEETKVCYRHAWQDMYTAIGRSDKVVDQPLQPYLCQLKVRSVPRAIRRMNEQGVAAGWNFPPAKLVTIPAWPGMDRATIKKVAQAALRMLEDEWHVNV